ncbi:hypothetical protein TWF569_005976 [Orbilia oligospora]|uniref:Uncharacterized protein n=1 Tax=Orbilia oligospora TaxID=2813651 RepID=A0A7C8NS94_ORBOL|nr:hypothetical protein TWF102_004855 [Orbilia oligospora]KAF3104293.1 hypothetical protein TWF103_006956 [Orbilia oligospora]KAF3108281.1 hypothetical protein TWF706_002173 [Orbilia oligospora]KAF3146123.1 hypothetical protein TWF703_005669 [Orbilia oligospora]KAF3147864.1 hypothetical protein TWF569_005976 [Orbilia oligospora]
MGWLWGSSGSSSSGNDKDKAPDSKKPISNLDPSLDDYFKSSTPKDDKPTIPPPAEEPLPELKVVDWSKKLEDQQQDDSEPPPPHSLSAYGDRYQEYWATYRGPRGIRADGPEAQMREIVEGMKQKRFLIGNAARENCSFEEEAMFDCYKNGSWWQTLMMCRAESQRFGKCQEQQKEFLKALGYLSEPGRDPVVEERIQMHADKLFRQQLAQDDATIAALKSGQNIGEAVAKIKAQQATENPAPDGSNLKPIQKDT